MQRWHLSGQSATPLECYVRDGIPREIVASLLVTPRVLFHLGVWGFGFKVRCLEKLCFTPRPELGDPGTKRTSSSPFYKTPS